MDIFTVSHAQDELARLRPLIDEFVVVRADAAELAASLTPGATPSALGGLPELKAAQARLEDIRSEIEAAGVEVKGFAPLLLDFPAELDGVAVFLCWLEGDAELTWFHRRDLGFAGRRQLAE